MRVDTATTVIFSFPRFKQAFGDIAFCGIMPHRTDGGDQGPYQRGHCRSTTGTLAPDDGPRCVVRGRRTGEINQTTPARGR